MAYPRDESVASRIKRAGLPETYNVHWSQNRKAEVVHAVRSDVISLDEARGKYLLSRREFETWQDQFADRVADKKELELH
ncbi:DUF1153 domain-containing protein [Pontixanthobacter aestiaquae]|uniref:DUF1153 domain-containing protein n=1 Tax=Pontixanthobacter aestiaquae TaxID=1509367 RepID=A0A844Z632_9SPHN|nr:DUF1153 domain-containing protein [Pontixanthobacter aestiaquae]MDN3644898.1 DUF1153 domain-containing protein [Pontixanthobacter aestiaquae]MXO84101.1 DUF1153 domain-containing protein [Pontixanthobacter aestiaquae]